MRKEDAHELRLNGRRLSDEKEQSNLIFGGTHEPLDYSVVALS